LTAGVGANRDGPGLTSVVGAPRGPWRGREIDRLLTADQANTDQVTAVGSDVNCIADPRGQRLAQPGIGAATDRGFDERHDRVGERRDSARDLERCCAQAVEVLVSGACQRSHGIGSSSPAASGPALRCSTLASSSAKKGLPPEVATARSGSGAGTSRRVAPGAAPEGRPSSGCPSRWFAAVLPARRDAARAARHHGAPAERQPAHATAWGRLPRSFLPLSHDICCHRLETQSRVARQRISSILMDVGVTAAYWFGHLAEVRSTT
jgi:hypothetical protein